MFDLQPSFFISLNKIIGESGIVINPNSLASVTSSAEYYVSSLEKAASITRSLLMNHPFADGNKRTGFVFLTCAVAPLGYNLTPIASIVATEFVVSCVTQKWGVEKIVDWVVKHG